MQTSSLQAAGSRQIDNGAVATRRLLAGGAVLVVAAAILALWPLTSPLPVWSMLAAAVLYILSHLLRGFRLAILSMEMLGISGRTAVLLHFATAPLSLVVPLKLGEVARLYELWRLSGRLIYSIVVLLVDRMYDSLFLVPLLLVLLAQNEAGPVLIVLTSVAAFVPLAVIVVGPRLMTEVQRYVVAHHNDNGTLKNLRGIDAVRRLVTSAASVARQQAPTLVVLSLLIWLLEVLVVLILVSAVTGTSSGAFDLLGSRLTDTLWTSGSAPFVQAAIAVTLMASLLIWPVAIIYYVGRRAQAISAGWQESGQPRGVDR